MFLMAGDIQEFEDAIAAAASAALKQFLAEEMDEAANASMPMGEVHQELLKQSKDVTASLDRHMDVLDARLGAL